MQVTLVGTCKIAKALATKLEKIKHPTQGPIERVRCSLTVSDLLIDRPAIDRLTNMPPGWAEQSLFYDTGEPRSNLMLTLPKRPRKARGQLGTGTEYPFALPDAVVDDLAVILCPMGGGLSACFTWNPTGGEQELHDLLGRITGCELEIDDAMQSDLFEGRPPADQPPPPPEPDRTVLEFGSARS